MGTAQVCIAQECIRQIMNAYTNVYLSVHSADSPSKTAILLQGSYPVSMLCSGQVLSQADKEKLH